jgi:hypothetical protein
VTKTAALRPPFHVPSKVETGLARVRDYWLGLRRGQADIPFADDVKLSTLGDFDVDLMVIDVFERPARFRIGMASAGIGGRYGQLVEGLFIDEIEPHAPLDYLVSQCSATVEGRSPTYYRRTSALPYARLLLPLWGDGHISALLAAVSFR